MSGEPEQKLQVEPVITLPEVVLPGEVAIVEVGLKLCDPQHWPYEEDSFRFGCMLDGSPDFIVESIDRHDVTLTKDGVGDDSMRFAVTARMSTQGIRSLWLSLTTGHGVVVKTYELQLRVESKSRNQKSTRDVVPRSLAPTRSAVRHTSVVGSQGISVFVGCEPDNVWPGRYRLSAWIVDGLGNDAMLLERSHPISLAGVQAAAQETIAWTEQAGILDPRSCRIEFALPRDMLDLPVETWRLSAAHEATLGSEYPVVVRSLDRLRSTDSHGTWLRRWSYLVQHADEPTSEAAVWSSLDRSWWRPRAAGLDHAVCLALDWSVTDHQQAGYAGLDAAVRAGLPVVIWPRKGASASEWSELRNLLRHCTLGDLPDAVQELRREALAAPPGEPHLGKHLVLLWDDPIRVPRVHPGLASRQVPTAPVATVVDAKGRPTGTAFFVGPQTLLTSRSVVRNAAGPARPATVAVEFPDPTDRGPRRIKGVVRSDIAGVDAALIELEAPVRLARPPALAPLHGATATEVTVVGAGITLPGRLIFADSGRDPLIAFEKPWPQAPGMWAGFSGGPVVNAEGRIVGMVTTATNHNRLALVPIERVAKQWITKESAKAADKARSPVELMNVVDGCLQVPLLGHHQLRQQLVDALPPDLSAGMLRHRRDRFDVYGLLNRCAQQRHGLDELLNTARACTNEQWAGQLAQAIAPLQNAP